MANVVHSTLTGADLHEPKGVAAAAANTVYTADGVGSGAWSTGSTLIGITGQVADFATPLPPTGWLECDGTAVSRSTFSNLFSAVTIQQTGTRTNASAIITGLTSTTNMRVGYFIGGVGITNGTTILTVDSATQVTMSANAGSSGSGTIIVSPFAQGDGTTTFTLPDTATAGRYRRSRSSTSRMGIAQADATKVFAHTHPIGFSSTGTGSGTSSGSGTTSGASADHTHTYSGSTGGVTVQHQHTIPFSQATVAAGTGASGTSASPINSGVDGPDHAHTYSGTTAGRSADHTHTFSFSGSASITSVSVSGSGTSGAASTTGDTETRPVTIVLMTCIKT